MVTATVFRVNHNGATAASEDLTTRTLDARWKQRRAAAIIGAVAIPEGINQYTEGYTRLLAQLYADQEFRKACASGP
jgi:hypothetical protein